MNDFLSITLDGEQRKLSKEEVCNRSLIASILYQAAIDISFPKNTESFKNAKRFINPENKMFKYYCELLDYDPEWISKKILNNIKK